MKDRMNASLHDLMREATRLTQGGQLAEATAALQQALRGAMPAASPTTTADPGLVIDGHVFEVPEPGRPRPAPAAPEAAQPSPAAQPDSFVAGVLAHGGRSWRYKLYVPPAAAQATAAAPLPLVVMLHGCTQNPDDFAAGTGMNTLAREQGFYVLYPEQSQGANPQRCWNWFKHNHQQRGSGEPAAIAALVQTVRAAHPVDAGRVYVAGLSAGGAMAAIVAAAYPDVFAAAGVHSGLPGDAAGNLQEALAAMNGSATGPSAAARTPRPAKPVPTIVFHGDADATVHPRNGERLLSAAVAGGAGGTAAPEVEQGRSAGGRRFSRRLHRAADGRTQAEHWLVHGAGHAWAGGQPRGSYTDAAGPDASREMLRFFLQHRLPA